jgi:hypothetical protein
MAQVMTQRGYFSVLRWRSDVGRDEAKNLAILLVDPEGQWGGMRAAPLSAISSRLKDQGILDSMLVGLSKQFESEDKPDLTRLQSLRETLQHSIYLTEPKPTAVADVNEALHALYRAFIAPKAGGARVITKGVVLDRVVETLRKRGFSVNRGHYVEDFLFDAVVKEGPRQPASALEVLSFATAAKEWTGAEHDAGHFLYAVEQVRLQPLAVVQPPDRERSADTAAVSFKRVMRWFDKAGVRTVEPSELADPQLALIGEGRRTR